MTGHERMWPGIERRTAALIAYLWIVVMFSFGFWLIHQHTAALARETTARTRGECVLLNENRQAIKDILGYIVSINGTVSDAEQSIVDYANRTLIQQDCEHPLKLVK